MESSVIKQLSSKKCWKSPLGDLAYPG